jgi:hypothetical protein
MKGFGSMSLRVRRARAPLAVLALIALAGTPLAGCGEASPPPLTQEGFEAAKKEREAIIKKEYGQRAYDKAVGKKGAGKQGP